MLVSRLITLAGLLLARIEVNNKTAKSIAFNSLDRNVEEEEEEVAYAAAAATTDSSPWETWKIVVAARGA